LETGRTRGVVGGEITHEATSTRQGETGIGGRKRKMPFVTRKKWGGLKKGRGGG